LIPLFAKISWKYTRKPCGWIWHALWVGGGQMRATFVASWLVAVVCVVSSVGATGLSLQEPIATFRSNVDLVRISAIVRDRKGRFVRDLQAQDFEVLEDGRPRPIADFRHDSAGASLAVLLDASGSMRAQFGNAREALAHLLAWLKTDHDETAVFAFDTHLAEVSAFGAALSTPPDGLSLMTPFGATSLHDAIAGAAGRVATRQGRRAAVVVFTDGRDTASRLRPGEVSAMARAIDVPVYIVGIVSAIDNPAADVGVVETDRSPLAGPLADLATETGGRAFVASSIVERSTVARRLVEELRHQYVIAFEASRGPGWHSLVVRARGKNLTVRTRSGYNAGQSRPNTQ
jgi:VWFA-related protein